VQVGVHTHDGGVEEEINAFLSVHEFNTLGELLDCSFELEVHETVLGLRSVFCIDAVDFEVVFVDCEHFYGLLGGSHAGRVGLADHWVERMSVSVVFWFVHLAGSSGSIGRRVQ